MKTFKLLYIDAAQQAQIEDLQALIEHYKLPLKLDAELLEGKLNQKRRLRLTDEYAQPVLLLDNKKLDDKGQLSLLTERLSVALEWDKLQRRVVSAGRKSELLLQAAKLTADSVVIDATAGFGHDSLILASSGAQVTMLEQQPLMALLLLAEQQRMSRQPNWQKLMSRLHIINIDALSYFTDEKNITNNSVKVIYLDPMFPADSYQDSKTGKGAKVGKHMQALHQLAKPPSLPEEQQLLKSAQAVISQNDTKMGRVVIKRPQQAPFFAQQPPSESWSNEALRFDGYFI
ncbi:class I SAM-dependent methyltransferase [Psychrobacter jeotgali]|uniref:class I SAM-dependent methyltransferase n=1 Tax=Psychrobacter jeotgali TaxID=179010 RepID=UPI001D1002EB|nr:class I SAM-dependent methyltransferase [Psychrobacter jeotgali]